MPRGLVGEERPPEAGKKALPRRGIVHDRARFAAHVRDHAHELPMVRFPAALDGLATQDHGEHALRFVEHRMTILLVSWEKPSSRSTKCAGRCRFRRWSPRPPARIPRTGVGPR